MQIHCLAVLFLAGFSATLATAAHAHTGLRGSALEKDTGAPAPAPAPSGADIDTLEVTWEIENLNYFDLTKPYVPGSTTSVGKRVDGGSKKRQQSSKAGVDDSPKMASDELNEGITHLGGSFDNMVDSSKASAHQARQASADQAHKVVAKSRTQEASKDENAMPWPTTDASLLARNHVLAKQVGTTTVQKVLRDELEGLFEHMFCGDSDQASPGPSPAAAPLNIPPAINAALLSMSALKESAMVASPAPSPLAMGSCLTPEMHVSLVPGDQQHWQKDALLLQAPSHAAPVSTKVKLTMYDRPNNGVDELSAANAQMQKWLLSKSMAAKLGDAIQTVTGIVPKVGDMRVQNGKVKPYDIEKCEVHMKKVVKTFAAHYTKRQVPMNLYNECTNFMAKISFSHDLVLDHRDEVRCRKATASFAKSWKLGKYNDPQAFGEMCVNFCEAKFGDDAPQCLITHGKKLPGQPL